MKMSISTRPTWAVALGFSIVAGVLYAVFSLPLDDLHRYGWMTGLRILLSLSALIASVIYCASIEEPAGSKSGAIPKLHLLPAGAAAGVACLLLIHVAGAVHVDVEILLASVGVGVVLAWSGVLGLIARGL